MEGIINKVLAHFGLPSLEVIHEKADHWLPLLKAFVDAGGLTAIKTAVLPHLNADALKALEALETAAKAE